MYKGTVLLETDTFRQREFYQYDNSARRDFSYVIAETAGPTNHRTGDEVDQGISKIPHCRQESAGESDAKSGPLAGIHFG